MVTRNTIETGLSAAEGMINAATNVASQLLKDMETARRQTLLGEVKKGREATKKGRNILASARNLMESSDSPVSYLRRAAEDHN